MAFNPTDSQKNAINVDSGALVCAAAGSGKTAVLAERVVRLLTGDNPISADRILVVTFMSAAAEEMRQRIEKRLNAEFSLDPQNKFLYAQKLKLRNAKICTIDSFCIELVRENFDVFGISPDFKVGDDNAVSKLSEQVLSDILNKEFADNSPDFKALLNALCSKFDESDLKDAIINLYYFSQNLPFPDIWFKDLTESMESGDYTARIISNAFSLITEKLNALHNKITLALSALTDEKIYDTYYPILFEDKVFIEELLSYAKDYNWNGLFEALYSKSFSRWPSPKNAICAELTAAKKLREDIKKEISALLDFVYSDDSSVIEDINSSLRLVIKLLSLSSRYSAEFTARCLREGTLTFSQAEHYALDLLCECVDGKIVLKENAQEIVSRFDEVLVDEFQDINDMQDLLFNILSNGQKNLFVVGDVKQSIYGFRGSNPDNFLRKKDEYKPFDTALKNDFKKIILGNNFRSRDGICNYINYLFSKIMKGASSSIQYTDEEQLVPSAVFPQTDKIETDIHFIDITNSEFKATELEAQHISDFINNYIENEFVTAEENGEKILKTPKFSDFALLLRGVKSKGKVFAEILKKNGIPVKFSDGFSFDSAEVNILLSILTVIANPSRDIELVSVMMSPLFNFSADEMAVIRAKSKSSSFISAVTAASLSGDKKSDSFIEKLNSLRTASVTLGVGDLIDYIFEETGLLHIVSALPEGLSRKENLLSVYAKALEFQENNQSKNILKFVDYIKSLDSQDNIKASKEDAVTITTIHKSKGLQYPVCILADTSKRFSGEDTRKNLLTDSILGVGFKYFDNELNEKKESLQFKCIKERILKDAYEEEMRLMYVALTRAQEKLLIVNSAKNLEEKFFDFSAISSLCQDENALNVILCDSQSYFDWILKTSVIHPDFKLSNFEKRYLSTDSSHVSFMKIHAEEIEMCTNAQVNLNEGDSNISMALAIKENISYSYPYEAVKSIETKSSVAVVAHKADEHDFSFTSIPDFMSASGLSPSKRGTATHRFMQFCDFSACEKSVKQELDRLYEWEFISEAEREAVDIPSVEHFFKDDIYRRIKNSKTVKREMRFITEMPAGRFDNTLPVSVKDEPVVIQGSVDLVFEEDGKLIILDFKTDRITDEEKLKTAYAEQLNIYAAACAKIFEKPIGECLLYSFKLGKIVKI